MADRDPAGPGGGNGLTLWPNALTALDVIDAGAEVRAVSEPAAGLAMRTATGDTMQFVPQEVMVGRCGGNGRALLRGDLMRPLLVRARANLCLGSRCTKVLQEGVSVGAVLENGDVLGGDLLVGADGIGSTVRRGLFDGDDLRHLGYAVVRGVAPYAGPKLPAQLSMGCGEQFGMFPMTGGRVYWFAAFGSRGDLASRSSIDKDWLLGRFSSWHEPVGRLISATDPNRMVVSEIVDRTPLRRWSRGAATLVGDAAHPSAPTLGQGTCQALEDAIALTSCLAHESTDIPAALLRYEARRRRRANALTRQAHLMGRLGQWSHPMACWLRNRLISAVPRQLQVNQMRQMFAHQRTDNLPAKLDQAPG
ncbi:salicylate hydroxylase [Longimycelium tulufanense]|uniref:Salicylate hydroxylase n=1 Tax=Longimycelium tulufanense TaxID=907463 RepID=A0A8J3CEN9_9PSEU|nr:salicylate hydroxylase [Longimycelium tulufanense]